MGIVFSLQICPLEYDKSFLFCHRAQRTGNKLNRLGDRDVARNGLAGPGGIVQIFDDVHHDRRAGQQLRDLLSRHLGARAHLRSRQQSCGKFRYGNHKRGSSSRHERRS